MKNFLPAKNSLFAAPFFRHKFQPLRPAILAAACGLVVALTALPAQTQTCAPPPAGMVAWWPGDGNATDVIGGNNGTLIGGAAYGTQAQGLVGQAFSFSGSGRVSLASAPTSNIFTIDAWVYPHQISSPNGSRTIYADDARGLWLMNGKILWWGSGGGRFLGNNPVAINAWTHIAITYDGAFFRAYQNGEFDGQRANQGEFLPALGGIGIGGHNFHPEDFDGLIDEVEVFNRVLNQSEIQAIYNAGSAGKCKPKKGMTWLHTASNAQTGTITVGCAGCDGYKGDTACTEKLPLLCIYKPTPPFPLPVHGPAGVNNDNPYLKWSGGVVATTEPVAGNTFAHSTDATNYCKAQFGSSWPSTVPNWRVAEFHDGQYWYFQAYGGTVSAPTVPSTRFWVHINDQPAGNCWQTP